MDQRVEGKILTVGGPQAKPLSAAIAWGILLFIGLAWGLTFSLAKIATQGGAHPIGINFWPGVIGALFLGALCAWRREKLPLKRRNLVFYTACGLLGSVIPGALFYFAAAHVSPGVLAITVATVPLMTFVAAVFFGIEIIRVLRVTGVVFGIISIALLIGPQESLPDRSVLPWIGAALLAAVCYTAENLVIALRIPTGVSPFTVAFGMFLAATVLNIPLIAVTDTFVALNWPFDDQEWAIISLSAISALAYSLFIYLIAHAGPVFASQSAYIITFAGVLWGIIIFDESHSGWVWLSLVVMVGALVLVTPRGTAARTGHPAGPVDP